MRHFERGGNCSWVAPATDPDGRDVVFKVAWRHTEALHEAEGLAALGGQRAVEVYAFERRAARYGEGRCIATYGAGPIWAMYQSLVPAARAR